MEDSAAGYCWSRDGRLAVAKGFVMVCYKGNGVSAVYINGRVCTLPLPVRNSRKKPMNIGFHFRCASHYHTNFFILPSAGLL